MPNLVMENPKATITAIVGIVMGILQIFVPMDFLTPQMQVNINLVLYSLIVFLMGRWTRLTQPEAQILEKIVDNQEVNQVKK